MDKTHNVVSRIGLQSGLKRLWKADSDNVRRHVLRLTCTLRADWLKECRIEPVAMESTGVYWIPVLSVLESRGFDVKRMFSRTTSKYLVAKQTY